MDFFQHQERARRQTAVMVGLFLAAVLCIVGVMNLVGVGIWIWISNFSASQLPRVFALTPWPVYAICTGVTLLVITWGTATRVYELSGGGGAVARLVGARPVRRDTQDMKERRLLNIIEEMALASGISAPAAYVMDSQSSINAFAAGYSPNEAVVAVTRGALDQLTRDELQGVIGHEFSHILNGDMRLNIQLMGVIAGLVGLGHLGAWIMSQSSGSSRSSSGSGSSSSSSKDDRGSPILFAGLAIWIIGWIGVFFGTLIKAAISRQREFLADASSVQFTRNPEGLGGALVKIGKLGGELRERSAGELAHMCIDAPGSGFGSFSWLATHPPIRQRVERIVGEGNFGLLDIKVRRQMEQAAAAPEEMPDAQVTATLEAQGASAMDGGAGTSWGRRAGDAPVNVDAAGLVATVGAPSPAHMEAARRLLADMPADLREAARTADGVQALVCALLLGEGPLREEQLQMVRVQAGNAIGDAAASHADTLKLTDPRIRMPLLDLAMPVLKGLEPAQRDMLLQLAKQLVDADRRMTLAEFVLLTILNRHLARDPKGPPPVRHRELDTVARESATILSLLAHAGRNADPKKAFLCGAQMLSLAADAPRPPGELGFAVVEQALYELKVLAPLKKPQLIKACLATVMADGQITVLEGELMRAICAAIDSPLPPLIESGAPS